MSDAVYKKSVLSRKKRVESLWRRQTAMTQILRKDREIHRDPILGMPPNRVIDTRAQIGKRLRNVIGAVRAAIGIEALAGPECFVVGRDKDQRRGGRGCAKSSGRAGEDAYQEPKENRRDQRIHSG